MVRVRVKPSKVSHQKSNNLNAIITPNSAKTNITRDLTIPKHGKVTTPTEQEKHAFSRLKCVAGAARKYLSGVVSMSKGGLSPAWLTPGTGPGFGSVAVFEKFVGVGHDGREVEFIEADVL